jgi:ATP-dependent exoDNAse (exonuclease V) alpha subunit
LRNVRKVGGTGLEPLEHGYALTGHAAQGATVDRAFLLLRHQGALREWGYVACTRARLETRLYLVGHALEPDHHGRPVDERDPTARLAGALERSAAERVALTQRRPDTSDVSRRVFDRSRREREHAFATAEHRLAAAEENLAAAEEKLRGLGRLGHRRERRELQAEARSLWETSPKTFGRDPDAS